MTMLSAEFYEKYMNFADVAAIAGAISALAVLVSLLFLNIQVRLTEKNQRALRTCLRSFNARLIQGVLTTGGRHEKEVSE